MVLASLTFGSDKMITVNKKYPHPDRRMDKARDQINLLIKPFPQPASRKTVDSKAAEAIKILKIFNCFIPQLIDVQNARLPSISSHQ